MHAGNAGIKTDKLESLRIAVAKDSPMWETLDICIKVVDKNSLDILVPRLAQMVRSSVGLNTVKAHSVRPMWPILPSPIYLQVTVLSPSGS